MEAGEVRCRVTSLAGVSAQTSGEGLARWRTNSNTDEDARTVHCHGEMWERAKQ